MENFQIMTSVKAPEADGQPFQGMFLIPSEDVPGRPTDITGYNAIAQNELGKLEWNQVAATRMNPRATQTQTGGINSPVVVNGRGGIIYTDEVINLGISDNETFVVTNSYVSSTSIILLGYEFISEDPDQRPLVSVGDITSGQFDIVITTFTPNMTGTFIIRFIVN